MIKAVLLVMYVLNGEASTFAAAFETYAECKEAEAQVTIVLPQLLGTAPQVYAAACANVMVFETKV